MTILAIDPGTDKSAVITYDSACRVVYTHDIIDNEDFVDWLRMDARHKDVDHLAIEMIANLGMPVGREVFQTCVWIGRFIEAWQGPYDYVYRMDVKDHLCGSRKAKDANIRQALLDKFGGKDALGTKKKPGPLYGIKSHLWSALAVAVTFAETREDERG